MAHVRFIQDYDYDIPGTASTTAYKANWEGTVKRDCANKAIAAGVAEEIPAKGKVIDDDRDEAQLG